MWVGFLFSLDFFLSKKTVVKKNVFFLSSTDSLCGNLSNFSLYKDILFFVCLYLEISINGDAASKS